MIANDQELDVTLAALLVLLVVVCASCGGRPSESAHREINAPEAPPSDRVVAIVGGRLIDGRGGPPVENAVVVVRGSSITAAGSREAVPVPEEADQVVEASGLSVVPGFMDAHFHSVNDPDLLERFLQHGVTSFRDPGHPLRFYQGVLLADRPMPRAFLTGAHLDGFPPIWPQQASIIDDAARARQVVEQHVDRGASAIKIYFRLPFDLYPPVIETARAQGVPVTAHLELVDADRAIEAGVDGIEHVTSFGTALAHPDSARRFKEAVAENPDARRAWRHRLWSSINLSPSPRVQLLLDLIVENNVFVSPTLAVFERRAGDPDVTEMEGRGFEKMLRFVGRCHEAGATVVVGSHTWVPYADLGWAYHRELELLVQAGLSPVEAIRAGTLNTARFFRAENRLGSIEPGKQADLVLVEGDPSEDIAVLRNVRRVMLNGQWIQPGE